MGLTEVKSILNGSSPENTALAHFQEFLDFSARHRLYSLINIQSVSAFTDQEKGHFERIRKNQALDSLRLAHRLSTVLTLFKNRDIGISSIKGPLLGKSLFGDIGMRFYRDLDFVIDPGDLQNSILLLTENGFKLEHPRPDLSRRQWKYYQKYKKEAELVSLDGSATIELHTRLINHDLLKAPDESLFWKQMLNVKLEDIDVQIMNENNAFLYLLYHGGHHLYFRLFWLMDVSEALIRWNLDHRDILDKSLALGLDRLVGLGLLLVQEFFGTVVPAEYHAYIKDNKMVLERLKRICLMRILGPEKESPRMKFHRYRYNLMLRSGLKYKIAVTTSIFHRWYIRKFLGGH